MTTPGLTDKEEAIALHSFGKGWRAGLDEAIKAGCHPVNVIRNLMEGRHANQDPKEG
jgi:hypothetical protein